MTLWIEYTIYTVTILSTIGMAGMVFYTLWVLIYLLPKRQREVDEFIRRYYAL